MTDWTHAYLPACNACSCSGTSTPPAGESHEFSSSSPGTPGTPTTVTQRIDGVVVTGSGSGASKSPQDATGLPSGRPAGGGYVLEIDVHPVTGQTFKRWRHENPHNDPLGFTDPIGKRISELDYDEYGVPRHKAILLDIGRSATAVHSLDETEILLPPGLAAPENAVGQCLRFVLGGNVEAAIVTATGVNGPNETLIVEDPSSTLLEMTNASADLLLFASRGASDGISTAGTWLGSNYDSMSDTTTLTAVDIALPGFAAGWTLQLDAALPIYTEVVAIDGTSVIVRGDWTGVAQTGAVFLLLPPVGVDGDTGTRPVAGLSWESWSARACEPSRVLYAGYYYLPPMAGTLLQPNGTVGTTVHGRQPGSNFAGEYSCWHRVFSPTQGRWTSPDPLASPWSNLMDYVGCSPLDLSDPSGLQENERYERRKLAETAGGDPFADERTKALGEYIDRWGKEESLGAWSHTFNFRHDPKVLAGIQWDAFDWAEYLTPTPKLRRQNGGCGQCSVLTMAIDPEWSDESKVWTNFATWKASGAATYSGSDVPMRDLGSSLQSNPIGLPFSGTGQIRPRLSGLQNAIDDNLSRIASESFHGDKWQFEGSLEVSWEMDFFSQLINIESGITLSYRLVELWLCPCTQFVVDGGREEIRFRRFSFSHVLSMSGSITVRFTEGSRLRGVGKDDPYANEMD